MKGKQTFCKTLDSDFTTFTLNKHISVTVQTKETVNMGCFASLEWGWAQAPQCYTIHIFMYDMVALFFFKFTKVYYLSLFIIHI